MSDAPGAPGHRDLTATAAAARHDQPGGVGLSSVGSPAEHPARLPPEHREPERPQLAEHVDLGVRVTRCAFATKAGEGWEVAVPPDAPDDAGGSDG